MSDTALVNYGPEPLSVELREISEPEIAPDEVLLEVEAVGVCGSDLHKYHSSRDWAQSRNGMISGHEPTGVVTAVGPGVEHPHVGNRVCVYHRLGCGHCMDFHAANATTDDPKLTPSSPSPVTCLV